MKRHPNFGKARPWLVDYLANPPDTDECVPWPFAHNAYGYARIKWQGSQRSVPKLVLLHLVGPPPTERAEAAHAPKECHNPGCINPRHLRWATPKQNSADKKLDGTDGRGQRNTSNKLTEAQVLEIHAAQGNQSTIAARYGVSKQLVSAIRAGQRWGWLTEPGRVVDVS